MKTCGVIVVAMRDDDEIEFLEIDTKRLHVVLEIGKVRSGVEEDASAAYSISDEKPQAALTGNGI